MGRCLSIYACADGLQEFSGRLNTVAWKGEPGLCRSRDRAGKEQTGIEYRAEGLASTIMTSMAKTPAGLQTGLGSGGPHWSLGRFYRGGPVGGSGWLLKASPERFWQPQAMLSSFDPHVESSQRLCQKQPPLEANFA